MQVVTISAAQSLRIASQDGAVDRSPPPSVVTLNLSSMSAPTRALLSYIASSSKLTAVEKRAFIQLLAEIDAAGGDPKLVAKVMAMIQLTESARRDGDYARHSQGEVDEVYWDDRAALAPAAETPQPTRTQDNAPREAYPAKIFDLVA